MANVSIQDKVEEHIKKLATEKKHSQKITTKTQLIQKRYILIIDIQWSLSMLLSIKLIKLIMLIINLMLSL